MGPPPGPQNPPGGRQQPPDQSRTGMFFSYCFFISRADPT
jgi:hypothetical protein